MIGEATYGEAAYAGDPESDVSSWVPMAGVIGDTVAFGPSYYTASAGGELVSGPGVFVPQLVLEVAARNDLGTVDSTALDDTFGRSFLDEFNDTGSGQLTYANTDTTAAAAVDLDMLVTFVVWGVRAWSMLVESQTRVTAAASEEYGQTTTALGRGHLCVTDEAVLYPSRGTGVLPIEEDRTFNWSTPSPVYDDSGWGNAYTICSVGVAQSTWPWQPFAAGWPGSPFASAGVLWSNGSTVLGPAPVGFVYFRKDFTVADDGFYLFYAACDNAADLWLDGQKVLTLGNFQQSFSYSVFMTAGDHTIALQCENYYGFPGYLNPAGLAVAIYIPDAANEPSSIVVQTDSSWKMVAYPPAPPGMLVGKVLHVVFDEAVARGELTDVTLMFTETTDSAGQPWPVTVDIATKIGTSYLVFLIELTATYIDVWMKPGSFELYAWNKGTRPAPAGLTLVAPVDPADPTTGNMVEQAHTRLL